MKKLVVAVLAGGRERGLNKSIRVIYCYGWLVGHSLDRAIESVIQIEERTRSEAKPNT